MSKHFSSGDAELEFLLGSGDSNDVMSLVTDLVVELEREGFEKYFLGPNGGEIFACASALDQAAINKDSPAARLLWDAMAVIGLGTPWYDVNARKRAIDILTTYERDQLSQFGELILDCLYNEDIITDR